LNHYIFRGDKEFVEARLTDDRKLLIKNNLTNNEFVEIKERLFGNDRKKRAMCSIMISRLPKLNENEVDVYLNLEFYKMGYVLVSKDDKRVNV